MSSSEEKEPEALGWNAIDDAIRSCYGDSEPLAHYAARLHAMLGGNDYLQGVSVYLREKPCPHFHYVTYGFTELYEKEWKDPEWSGFGFELTFRLKKYDAEPPTWPVSLLQNLGRYVFTSGRGFEEGHYLDCRGKLALGEETELCAILLSQDPDLKSVASPNGQFHFLQVFGITHDEQRLIQRWNSKRLLEAFVATYPQLITDLYRKSILNAPSLAQDLERKAKSEGSSSGAVFVGEAHFTTDGKTLRLIFGASAAAQVSELLVPRLSFSRELQIASARGRIVLVPGEKIAWKVVETDIVEVVIPAKTAEYLSNLLQPKAGIYQFEGIPSIVFEIRRTEVKDPDGKIVEVIG